LALPPIGYHARFPYPNLALPTTLLCERNGGLIGSDSGLGQSVYALGPSSAHLIPLFFWQSAAVRIWLERLEQQSGCVRVSAIGASQECHHFI
jgi:hypothetical protein